MSIGKFFTFSLMAVLGTATLSAQQFTQGNLVVTRVGDGAATLSTGNTAPVSLLEFTTTSSAATLALTTQTPVKTVNITGGNGNLLTLSGNTIAEGVLNRSQDGKYLVMAGYNVAAGANATNYCVAGVSATDNGIMKVTVTNGGAGYASAPTVVFTGGGGTGAAATAIISGGAVSYIYVRTTGSGYTSTPVISFTGGSGSGAAATVDADRTSKGTGYTATGLTVTISAPDIAGGVTATAGAQVASGAISNIYLNTNGSGYTTQPTATITHSTGTGAKQCVYINPVYPYWQGTNVSKVIGRIDYLGAADYSTTITNITTSNGAPSPIKMVATTDGSSFWVANNVVTYVPFGSATGTQIANLNVTGIHIYKDQLLSTIPFGNINSYNTPPAPLPVTAVATPTNVIVQSGTTYGYQAIVLFDLDPTANWNNTGYDVMYVADRTYGLVKYYWNGTAWTILNYANAALPSPTPAIFPSGGLTTITGVLNSLGQPVIYGIIGATNTGNTSGLASITDASTYNTSMTTSNTSIAYLAKADANYGFRGVAFAPTQFPLPINLLKFSGSLINNEAVLQWLVATEVNAQGYIIEKSTDGASFTAIGSVAARNRNGGSAYQFTDPKLVPGLNYYRLRMTDLDGTFKYSGIVIIKNDGKQAAGISVFPNPVINNLSMSHEKATGGASVKIIAADGKTVLIITVATGAAQTGIDVSQLIKGRYFINYTNNGKTVTASFVK